MGLFPRRPYWYWAGPPCVPGSAVRGRATRVFVEQRLKLPVSTWRKAPHHPMPKAPAAPAPQPDPASYEAALEELEQLVARIESGQLPLEQMLAGYQRGAALLNFCRARLEAVQDQIKVLDEGALQPWTQE
ncbi:exodeoxyribonuclease VII small subunit [Alicycliphilus sp. B1]|nr:exodeoxyribonuclease VII small subunit [Alicycliphilus sp. B1]